MEYVDGPDLLSFLRNAPQPFDVRLALDLTRQIAESLAAAHARGWFTRHQAGEHPPGPGRDGWVPKIADFGIVATRRATALPAPAARCSPAVCRARAVAGHRPPLTSTAAPISTRSVACCFEMLTGQSAFDAEDLQSWAQMHLHLPRRRRPAASVPTSLTGSVSTTWCCACWPKTAKAAPRMWPRTIAMLDAVVYLPPHSQPVPIQSVSHQAHEMRSSKRADAPMPRPLTSKAVALPPPPAVLDRDMDDESAQATLGARLRAQMRRIPGHLWLLYIAAFLTGTVALVQIVEPPVRSRTLTGHRDAVFAVAFSPNGLTLASGSHDNTIQLWNVKDGTPLATLHDDAESVAWSPDGTTLATGMWDNTVKLWDATGGQVLATLPGHSDHVSSVAFSPDGKTLASGSWDKTIRLWDVASSQVLYTLNGHTDRVLSVSFSPDGRTLASGSADQTVKLWEVASGDLLRTLQGHSATVNVRSLQPGRAQNCLREQQPDGPPVGRVEWSDRAHSSRQLRAGAFGGLQSNPRCAGLSRCRRDCPIMGYRQRPTVAPACGPLRHGAVGSVRSARIYFGLGKRQQDREAVGSGRHRQAIICCRWLAPASVELGNLSDPLHNFHRIEMGCRIAAKATHADWLLHPHLRLNRKPGPQLGFGIPRWRSVKSMRTGTRCTTLT